MTGALLVPSVGPALLQLWVWSGRGLWSSYSSLVGAAVGGDCQMSHTQLWRQGSGDWTGCTSKYSQILISINLFIIDAASQVWVVEYRRVSKTSAPCSGLPGTSMGLRKKGRTSQQKCHYTRGIGRLACSLSFWESQNTSFRRGVFSKSTWEPLLSDLCVLKTEPVFRGAVGKPCVLHFVLAQANPQCQLFPIQFCPHVLYLIIFPSDLLQ